MMKPGEPPPHRATAAGFTLPAVLVVVGALLVLAVGILLVTGIERGTARSFVDRQRADLAARAGLEDFRGILIKEASNDDFLIVQHKQTPPSGSEIDPVPYLYLARGSDGDGGESEYRHIPLFSTGTAPAKSDSLKAPDPLDHIGDDFRDLATLPWTSTPKVAWNHVTNADGKVVSRYAYWVEDLQSRVDAGTAGNTKDAGAHKRYGWKEGDTSKSAMFPAPGLNAEESKPGADGRDEEPPLDQVALYALDPEAGAKDESDMDKTLIDGREALISPDSVLAVSGIVPPLTRGADGHLADAKARAVEENLTASVRPYDEQPLVPFANGLDPGVTGSPKLNLNALLAKPSATAIDEMAAWISKGIPDFENRKGGFPDNYLKTLAANALDYADQDNEASTSGDIMGPSAYRGLDSYPLMSEVILHFKYQGMKTVKGRKVLIWQIQVSVELWNHTNFPVNGPVRVSYENKLTLPALGAGIIRFFDDEALLTDPNQVKPTLQKIGDKFWSAEFTVNLAPNQYKFYNPITLDYTVDLGPSSSSIQSQFNIDELGYGDSGISLMWKGKEVDRSHKLLRGNIDPKYSKTDFITNFRKQDGFAHVPALSYGIPGDKVLGYKNNMGDSRQSLYLRPDDYPVSDNSYPANISPNQRNIRNASIYKNGSGQTAVYGRVLPSEWPDGGHDVPVQLSVLTPPNVFPKPDDYAPWDTTRFPDFKMALEGDTPTFVSNAGRFYSATELGRIFDPVMYVPTYDNSDSILGGKMPSGRGQWPSVETRNPSGVYHGGGNTLRIGRPEHPEFDLLSGRPPVEMPGKHAARLLDLFHAGKSRATSQEERQGNLVRIEGHINLNTATEDTLRALAAGILKADPRLARTTSQTHSASRAALPVTELEVPALTQSKQADVLAQAIIRGRPYASPSEIATSRDEDGKVAFGNALIYPEFRISEKMSSLQWSDAAAEEAFARVYNSSTVRSRNFRVWVIGQAVAPTTKANLAPEILSEVRKAYTVFADPGGRNPDGSIDGKKFKISIIHENDF